MAKANALRSAHFRLPPYPDTLAGLEQGSRPGNGDMTRADAIDRAHQHLHSGEFLAELDRRVGYQTKAKSDRRGALRAYLEEELQPAFSQLDFTTRLVESPTGKGPISSRSIARIHRRLPF